MYKFKINKLAWVNKFKFNKFTTFNISREKKFYILIFSSIIFTLFLMDIANKQITNNQLLTRDSLIANKDLSVLKDYIIKKINSPFTNINHKILKKW